ncbi:hypothetical protein NQ315_001800 [Exocentrus adspersus]|uniref:HIT-type domain-containing protein n=1 Tax=Exocentrus adspersus TaxID=1586481 RepID=A0AAV8W9I1_9CUCU|nr:hypothetical protein NQ315_001800 [Exocentrus adspersus]
MTISKSTLRGSNRLKEGDKRRVVDETSRKRRQRKVMELLESDNYHDDPHADLVMSKKIPRFDDSLEQRSTRTKKRNQLVDEDRAEAEANKRVSYMDIQCEESPMPPRHFCAVCGFLGHYSCLSCGTRFCCIRCMDTHADTRCLKWAA